MSTKRVVIVVGSPRKNGNSSILARSVADGAEAAGAEVSTFHLHNMDIRPCDACDACRKDLQAECILNDGMQKIYPELRRCDALVIATPIYWFTVSAQTKLFMDRCYALLGPQGNALEGKKIGIVVTYGDADPFVSGAVNALRTLQDAFNYLGAKIVGMVYGSADKAGEIAVQSDLVNKAFQLGGWLVTEA